MEELTEEKKRYREEYDEQVTGAQELLNSPDQASKTKLWEHIAIRPNTFKKFRALREGKGGIKSDDAFVNELIEAYESMLEQQT